jgi:hypothetical protein
MFATGGTSPYSATFSFSGIATFSADFDRAAASPITVTASPNPCIFNFGAEQLSCGLTISVPAGTPPGTYNITVTYVDNNGNHTLGTFKVQVTAAPTLTVAIANMSPNVGDNEVATVTTSPITPGLTVQFTADPAAGVITLLSPTCITNSNGSCTITIVGVAAGHSILTASASGFISGSVMVNPINPINPNIITVNPNPLNLPNSNPLFNVTMTTTPTAPDNTIISCLFVDPLVANFIFSQQCSTVGGTCSLIVGPFSVAGSTTTFIAAAPGYTSGAAPVLIVP